jgi:hypothetical protein
MMTNWLLGFVAFIDIHDRHFSPCALALWLIICSLGPVLFMTGVTWDIPRGFFYNIVERMYRWAAVGVIFAAYATFVGVFCGVDRLIVGSVNAFSSAFFAATWGLYTGVICKRVKENDFPEIVLVKEKVFMLFVMILQIPMLSTLLGFVPEYGLSTFLGWYGLVAAIVLTVYYVYSFWSMISGRIESLFKKQPGEDRFAKDFDDAYHTQVKSYRTAERHLYEDYTYIGDTLRYSTSCTDSSSQSQTSAVIFTTSSS